MMETKSWSPRDPLLTFMIKLEIKSRVNITYKALSVPRLIMASIILKWRKVENPRTGVCHPVKLGGDKEPNTHLTSPQQRWKDLLEEWPILVTIHHQAIVIEWLDSFMIRQIKFFGQNSKHDVLWTPGSSCVDTIHTVKNGGGSIMLWSRNRETSCNWRKNEYSQIQRNTWRQPAAQCMTPETGITLHILPEVLYLAKTMLAQHQVFDFPW